MRIRKNQFTTESTENTEAAKRGKEKKVYFCFLCALYVLCGLKIECLRAANPTEVFQMAEEHRSASRWTEAIPLYELRLSQEEGGDEIWASKYGLADCYDKTGQWKEALYWYLETFQ